MCVAFCLQGQREGENGAVPWLIIVVEQNGATQLPSQWPGDGRRPAEGLLPFTPTFGTAPVPVSPLETHRQAPLTRPPPADFQAKLSPSAGSLPHPLPLWHMSL